MKELIVFEREEFDNLLMKFVDEWIKQQYKVNGCIVIKNKTGERIFDRHSLCGSFLIPWNNTFKLDKT